MGEPMEPVVVGVDSSAESMSALDLAAEEAASRVAPLVVVHVCDPPTVGRADQPAAAQRLLAAAVSRASAEHPALSVTAELLSGVPADALVERAREASLMVLAHRPRCGARTIGARSVAHQVVSRSPVPVVVHRPLSPQAMAQQPRPVLVGVACAPGDDSVLEFAFEEAARRGAPLRAVHIWPGSVPSRSGWRGFEAARDEADNRLVDALRPWSEKYPEVAVQRMVRHGLDVPVSLTAASRSAQLVVVGTRHPDEGSRPLLCGAQVLAHRAGCSVAVVPVG
jgi:nucleotide-binding universal stress UspA family protein